MQVAQPKTISYRGNSVTTGIFKKPTKGPLLLKTLNLEGDGQADLRVHGGHDKALYVYSADAYDPWRKLRPKDSFPFGAMGENLTLDELAEHSLFVGDTYSVGDAIVQVTQPREPCLKLAIKFDDPKILKDFMLVNRPGAYFRVLKEGLIDVGHEFKLIQREAVLLSIKEFFDSTSSGWTNAARIREILTLAPLPSNWRKRLERAVAP